MLAALGYILFAIVVGLGGPLVLLLAPVGFLIGLPLSLIAHAFPRPRRDFLARIAAIVPVGIMAPGYVFGAALLARWIFSCSYTWLMVLGIAETYLPAIVYRAVRRIRDQEPLKDVYVFPVFLVVFLSLSYFFVF